MVEIEVAVVNVLLSQCALLKLDKVQRDAMRVKLGTTNYIVSPTAFVFFAKPREKGERLNEMKEADKEGRDK